MNEPILSRAITFRKWAIRELAMMYGSRDEMAALAVASGRSYFFAFCAV